MDQGCLGGKLLYCIIHCIIHKVVLPAFPAAGSWPGVSSPPDDHQCQYLPAMLQPSP